MSAAANAAGYLYAHGQLPIQLNPERSHSAERSQSSTRLEPKSAPWQDDSPPVKEASTPRIEYRKRRSYALPSIA